MSTEKQSIRRVKIKAKVIPRNEKYRIRSDILYGIVSSAALFGGMSRNVPLDILKTVAEETLLSLHCYLLSLQIDEHVIIGIRYFK